MADVSLFRGHDVSWEVAKCRDIVKLEVDRKDSAVEGGKFTVPGDGNRLNVQFNMRILIATVTAGAGHLQAAAALEEAWRALRPADTIETVDLLDFVPRLQRRVYVQGYVKLVKHAPELWGMVFKKTDNPVLLRKVARLRRGFAGRTNQKFVKYLKNFQPDAVICTHYLPVEIMAHLERKGFNPMTVCVV